MTAEQTMQISPSDAQLLLDVMHQIERASEGEDYRDFVNDVCTAMEKVPDNLKEKLRHLAGQLRRES